MAMCPYCAEVIQDGALKCRFCGEMLSGAPAGGGPAVRLCTNCNASMQAHLARCPICGWDFASPVANRPVPPAEVYATAEPVADRGPRPNGTTALTLGLISLIGGFLCWLPIVLGPFAWAAGSRHERECRALGFEPDGAGRAGKVLGIIATALLILAGVVFLAAVAIAALGPAIDRM